MRADVSPTRSGPKGSSRNESRLGQTASSHPILMTASLALAKTLPPVFGDSERNDKANCPVLVMPCRLSMSGTKMAKRSQSSSFHDRGSIFQDVAD